MGDPTWLRAPAAGEGARGAGRRPTVSVIVPAYNAAETIGDALESVLNQVPAPLEVVVSDDGSDDDLPRALRPFAGRIRLVAGSNAGVAVARNRAAAVAAGDWLALVDADDVWLPGRLEAFTRAAAARPDLSILTTDAVLISDSGPQHETYYATRSFETDRQDLAIVRGHFILGAGAVRADAFSSVGGYRAGTRYAEDWELFLRLVLRGHRAGLIERPLYEYRRRSDSLTGHKLELAIEVLGVLARARELVTTVDQRRELARTEQQWRETAARAARRAGDPRARRLAARAAVGSPATLRGRARLMAAATLPAAALARLGAAR